MTDMKNLNFFKSLLSPAPQTNTCVLLPSSLFPSAAAGLKLGWTELVPVLQMPCPLSWMSIPLGREERER